MKARTKHDSRTFGAIQYEEFRLRNFPQILYSLELSAVISQKTFVGLSIIAQQWCACVLLIYAACLSRGV